MCFMPYTSRLSNLKTRDFNSLSATLSHSRRPFDRLIIVIFFPHTSQFIFICWRNLNSSKRIINYHVQHVVTEPYFTNSTFTFLSFRVLDTQRKIQKRLGIRLKLWENITLNALGDLSDCVKIKFDVQFKSTKDGCEKPKTKSSSNVWKGF